MPNARLAALVFPIIRGTAVAVSIKGHRIDGEVSSVDTLHAAPIMNVWIPSRASERAVALIGAMDMPAAPLTSRFGEYIIGDVTLDDAVKVVAATEPLKVDTAGAPVIFCVLP